MQQWVPANHIVGRKKSPPANASGLENLERTAISRGS
jgi:hypothetical protein